MRDIQVNIYGDSLMKGTVIDPASCRYRATMSQYLDALSEKEGLQFCNRSRFGIPVARGQQIVEQDMQEQQRIDYALIEFGGNDCNFKWDEVSEHPDQEHVPMTEITSFRNTLLNMLKTLNEHAITPLLMTLPPIDAERYFEFIARGNSKKNLLQWLGDVNMIYRFHEMYSNAIAKIALQTNTLLVDVRARFLDKRNYRQLIGLDGIHLAPDGYKLLVSAFQDFVNEKREALAQRRMQLS